MSYVEAKVCLVTLFKNLKFEWDMDPDRVSEDRTITIGMLPGLYVKVKKRGKGGK
jgi:hypothetical protein